jgi:hypothetical protein
VALGSNAVSGTKAQFNAALTDADFATQDGVETLTNKTLTAPIVTGGTVTGSTLSDSANVFPWVIQAGGGVQTLAAQQVNTDAVVFPTAFASAPSVVASVTDERFAFAVKNVTTTGFDLSTFYIPGTPLGGSNVSYDWVAIK